MKKKSYTQISPDNSLLPDVQSFADGRGLHIHRVGVTDVLYPIRVPIRSGGFQQVNAVTSLYSSLKPELKGANMSRFIESLASNGENVMTPENLFTLLDRMHKNLDTEDVYVRFDFTLIRNVAAPVTHKVAPQGYKCAIVARSNARYVRYPYELMYEVIVPVATVCPCSKEMSLYPVEWGDVEAPPVVGVGAHNQRTYIRARVKPTHEEIVFYFEELIDLVEEEGSVRLFPLLKRPDEKWMTETGYNNPKFVEDVARDVATALMQKSFIKSYDIRAESKESIHHHNALAYVKSVDWDGGLS